MKDETATSLAPFKKPKSVGGLRSTAALLLSLLACVVAGYGLLKTSTTPAQDPSVVNNQLADMRTRMDALQASQQKLETSLGDVRKEAQQLAETMPTKIAPVPSHEISAELGRRVNELEKTQQELADRLAANKDAQSRTLAAYMLLENIGSKIGRGLRYTAELEKLQPLLDAEQAQSRPFQTLKSYVLEDVHQGSDIALRANFRPLAAEILAKEKMDNATNFMDKVGVQLKKLVNIRPKEGAVFDGSPTAAKLNELATALEDEAWKQALTNAETLGVKTPPRDYPAWISHLRLRTEVEAALDALREPRVAATAATADE